MNSIVDRAPWIFAIGLLGLVPFLHSHLLNDPVLYPQLMGASVCLAAILAILAWKTQAPADLQPQIGWLLGGMVLLTAVSSLWALNPSEALFVSARWAFVLPMVLLCQRIFSGWQDALVPVCKVILVSMSVNASLGILQWCGIDPLGLSDIYQSPNGLQANRNFFGSALVLGIPFVVYLGLQTAGPWRVAAIAAVGLLLTGIVISFARAAIVPILIGIAFMPPIIIWRKLKAVPRWVGLGIWLGITLFAIWSTQFILKQKDAKFDLALLLEDGHRITPKSSSLDYRLVGWHDTFQMIADRPWTGVGAGNWKLEVPRYGLQGYDAEGHYGMLIPLHPHNEFLAAFSELGVLGLLLLLGIWGMGFAGALRMALRRTDRAASLLGGCLVFAWIALSTDASFSFPLERPLQLILFCLVLALSMRGYAARQFTRKAMWTLTFVALALVFLAAVDLGGRMQADLAMRKVRDANARHEQRKVLQYAPQARNWATQLDPVSAWSVDWYVAMAHAAAGETAAALQAVDRALATGPHQLAHRSCKTSLLDMTGQQAAAIAGQNALLETFPDFSEGWLNLSIMHIHAGDLVSARQSLAKADRGSLTNEAPTKLQELYDRLAATLAAPLH